MGRFTSQGVIAGKSTFSKQGCQDRQGRQLFSDAFWHPCWRERGKTEGKDV
jgi:hypothetical protein